MRIILLHWTSGGTGITNFCKSELPRYEAAIEAFGDPDLVICSRPFMTQWCASLEDRRYSLHDLCPDRDLGRFWDCYDKLECTNQL